METPEERHFRSIFTYIAAITVIVLLYVMCITFIPIPKENQRFVDIALAFLLGFISSNSQYLTGGNPKKTETPSIVQTGDSPTATTTTTDPQTTTTP